MREVDLFIMSGQSNMQGQSEAPLNHIVPLDVACEYKRLSDSLEPVRCPSGEDILGRNEALLLGAHQGYGSLLPGFAQGYHQTSGRYAAYVHAAKGATCVSEWARGTARYDALCEKTRAAVEKLERTGFALREKCFVWLQGESDGIVGTTESAYQAAFEALWRSLKEDLKLRHCLIIRIARFYDYPCLPIMAAQEALCARDADFCMLTRITQSFTVENGLMQDRSAPFHYTNAGYERVGLTAGINAAKRLRGEPFELEPDEYLR